MQLSNIEKCDLSIIIPVFNAAESLPELANRLINTLNAMCINYELIFIDDFSKDNSWEILKKIKRKLKEITIIQLSKNYGQHNATMCGIAESKGDIVVTIDDDLEHPPEIIPQLYKQFIEEKRDLLYATPIKRQKNWIRNGGSNLWGVISKASKKNVGEASSFRLIHKTLCQKLLTHNEPFIFLEAVLFWYTKNIGHQKINFEKRKYGQSNYSSKKLIFLHHDISMSYDSSMLQLMMYVGEIVSTFSFLLIIYYLYKKFFGHPLQGYTSLIVVILFSTGALMWGMGYLGLYIGKIMRIMNKEPQYNISKKITK